MAGNKNSFFKVGDWICLDIFFIVSHKIVFLEFFLRGYILGIQFCVDKSWGFLLHATRAVVAVWLISFGDSNALSMQPSKALLTADHEAHVLVVCTDTVYHFFFIGHFVGVR